MFNRKDIILHHDNARPHAASGTCQKIAELCWENLLHPPYSLDLAPSDYHLFFSLQNFLRGKNFKNKEDIKQALVNFFASKDETFSKMEYTNFRHAGKESLIIMAIILFSKVY